MVERTSLVGQELADCCEIWHGGVSVFGVEFDFGYVYGGGGRLDFESYVVLPVGIEAHLPEGVCCHELWL